MKTSRQTPAPGRGGPGIPVAQDEGLEWGAASSAAGTRASATRRPAPPRAAPGNRVCGASGGSLSLQVGGTGGCTRPRTPRGPHCPAALRPTCGRGPCGPLPLAPLGSQPEPRPHRPPGPRRAGGEGTTCPTRAGAGGAGRAPLPEPERTPAAGPGRVRTSAWPSRAQATRARGDASPWTVRWGLFGRERVRPGVCEGSTVSGRGHGRATDPLRFNGGRNGPSGVPFPVREVGNPGCFGDAQKEVVENEDSYQRGPRGQCPYLIGY